MPLIRLRDLTLYYETQGTGPPLLLIAGLNSDHTFFRAMLPRLAEQHQVIALDNRGVGKSDKPPDPYTIETMADDAAELLDALSLGPVHVLGVSLGGRIALALALRHPALVACLVLVSTSAEPPPPNWTRRLVFLSLRLPLIRRGNPYYAVEAQRAATRSFNCTDQLPTIAVPALILHGTRDRLAPLRLAKKMRDRIPCATLRTFDGGHIFFIMRIAPFLDEVLRFLDGRDASER
jgi:pimeloyl-ACP methyl ester carboxylesterase